LFWLITYYRQTNKHTHTHTHTYPTYTSTIFYTYTHSLLRAESPGGCAVAECSPSVCTGVPLVCVCEQIGTCRGRRAPPRHRWAYLCARRVAHARRSARRRRRRPRHTHRTPFGPTPSRPVRSESASVPDLLRYTPTRAAHTTFSLFRLFCLFFSFFPLSFLVFCPRTQTQRLALANTLKHTHRIHINKRKRYQSPAENVQRPRPRDTGQVLYHQYSATV